MKVGDKIETLYSIPFGCQGVIVRLPAGSKGKIVAEHQDWAWIVQLDKPFDCITSFVTGKEFDALTKVV
jgi:hypothetical protein